MRIYKRLFNKIVDPENLFLAWDRFKKDKRSKPDVQEFEKKLEQNIFQLYRELKDKTYQHGPYEGFFINDPKRRHIHKATVWDRVLHHALFQILNPIFERTFISNSFSCRVGKGSHKGVEGLRRMLGKESMNFTKQCYVLKCDVRKFFDSINHNILVAILCRKIKDEDTLWLLENIIESYQSERSDLFTRRGVPIGNLTSQLFANIYMNEFDQFVKHTLKVVHYARYTDDFVVVSRNKNYLESLINPISKFLDQNLGLELHPNKTEICSAGSGVDFLGYVSFPYYTLLRRVTKRRIFRRLKERIEQYKRREIEKGKVEASLHSYLGVLSHANVHNLSVELKNYFWLMVNSGDW